MNLFRSSAFAALLICLCFSNSVTSVFGEEPNWKRLLKDKKIKPNVLFIAIDDQNDWIGCLGGHPQIKTPNIDSLAARGTLFLNAHCQSPLCNSSRTSLMTGLRPSTTGIYGLAPWFRSLDQYKDLVSLPQAFKKGGYKTLSAGKIYHGGYGRRKKDSEFDELGPHAGIRVWPKDGKLVNTPAEHKLVDWGTFPHKDEEKGDYLVANYAIEKLDELAKTPEQPFFLSAGFFLPHVPCYATQKWFDLYPEESLQLPPFKLDDRDDTPRFSWYLHWQLPEPRHTFLKEANQWKNLVRSYLACTSFVDDQVGRILKKLRETGLEENTVVVLWSDHGWHLGEKQITGKNSLWDRSTRVPLIFAGPGVTEKQRCTRPAELLDVYPTLLELCGLEKNDKLEGISLLPQLENHEAIRPRPAITTHNHDNHGVRSENWRYIQYADGSEELYDMRVDPNEWKNLASSSNYDGIKKWHQKFLPNSVKPAKGSKHRILTYENGEATWQGTKIEKDAAIPELESTPKPESEPTESDSNNSQLPNVLFILADDLGFGDVQCYNPDSKIPTPNLNMLAKQGVRFTDAHSPSTVCTPTRYSLLTGRMAFRTGMRGVFDGVGGPCMIDENRLTLQRMLRNKGYTTACFGKWHIGMSVLDKEGKPINSNGLKAVRRIDYSRAIPDAPIHRGFDRFFGTVSCPTTDWLYAFVDGDRIPVAPTGLLDKTNLPKHPYSRDNRRGMHAPDFDLEKVDLVFLDKSKKFLEAHAKNNKDQPFFLFHSMQAVHLPSFPADQFKGKTGSGPHGDFIFEMDYVVGELMKTLDKLKLSGNTIVMFSSDNGPEVPTVVAMRRDHKHDGAKPWRGMKRDNWEGGHRVPFIARWPGKIKPKPGRCEQQRSSRATNGRQWFFLR